MKITRSWLEDYLDISVKTEELCHELTMAGLEVDEITKIGNDDLIDIDLTPNRSDCLSVFGVSRELNIINKKYKMKPTENKIVNHDFCENTGINFTIQDNKICPRYSYIYLKNISSSYANPENINARLRNSGVNLIHPIVDMLNYIMLDFGQPMHAYDADKIMGDVVIRLAKKNEVIKALDGVEYKLTNENIVITDSKEIISLAGIIGSENTSVTESTKNIIIESAFFDPKLLANKARKLKLHTESSHRFERGVDFNLPEKALQKLINILQENKVCEYSGIQIIEDTNFLPKKNKVKLNYENIRKEIGIEIENDEILKLLLLIGCEYDKSTDSVINPSHRYDLCIHADYVEEIARLYGYDTIPIVPEKISLQPTKRYAPFEIVNNIKNYLYKNSYSECINYSFVNDSELENYDWKHKKFENHKEILNYMSIEQYKLRSNLASSLIKNIQLNLNVNSENSYKFFEIANVFGDNLSRVLTCVAHGDKHDENWTVKKRKYDKFDMTSIVEDIAKIFGLKKSDLIYEIKEIVDNKLMYITLSLSIDKLIDKIKNNSKEKFTDYSKLPYIRRDLSFFIDVNITYESILRFIEKTNVHSLKKILLFDLYIGKNVPKEKKSLGMGFIFQEDTKTLTHKEADIYIEEIVKGLKDEFKIELRE